MAHGVRIVQSLSDMTSFDRAAAEWYLSGKFGSHWPELMGHDQAGSSYVRIPIDSLLTLVPICGSCPVIVLCRPWVLCLNPTDRK